jgi:hypothetical protein
MLEKTLVLTKLPDLGEPLVFLHAAHGYIIIVAHSGFPRTLREFEFQGRDLIRFFIPKAAF